MTHQVRVVKVEEDFIDQGIEKRRGRRDTTKSEANQVEYSTSRWEQTETIRFSNVPNNQIFNSRVESRPAEICPFTSKNVAVD